MSFGLALDKTLAITWRVFMGMLVTLLASGCSILQTPDRLNDLAAELRATTEKINKTLDDPEAFVSRASKGIIRGGLESLEDKFSSTATELTELQEIESKTLAGALGNMGIPGGDAIGLGLLYWLRSHTRKKDLAKATA